MDYILCQESIFFSGKANSVEEASKMLVTAAFTRHPFHRLVSAYRDKIARRNTRFFTPIRKHIIETYRKRLDLMKSHQGKYRVSHIETDFLNWL